MARVITEREQTNLLSNLKQDAALFKEFTEYVDLNKVNLGTVQVMLSRAKRMADKMGEIHAHVTMARREPYEPIPQLDPYRRTHPFVTARNGEIFLALLDGRSNAHVGISVDLCDGQVRNIFKKMAKLFYNRHGRIGKEIENIFPKEKYPEVWEGDSIWTDKISRDMWQNKKAMIRPLFIQFLEQHRVFIN